MSDPIVAGHCDPRFQAVRDQFAQALASGFDTGASVAVEHQGETVSYTHLTLPTKRIV